ncbi:sigma-70 family RNA polymerase sigma factor [Kineosporia sp. J2-2]|uniref:RNA polymerase sigma factor n=1 Tax=Kineosporia corallincola TaxID=2835133 RepID=A0ABS5TGM2_9ACTN|nr:sigma-70 family RNA polymerase sigma factor [Kineosporia corallincola]MBT0770226.1 sigma-70 family RNA polymerase sigma factor [Kineosporia corallincola]
MQTSHPDEKSRVVAARSGDLRALEDVLQARLPFVYTIVRRALGPSPDVDDIVQETMLRALRELPRLRQADSFRAWLAAIAIRQISTHRHRLARRAANVTAFDDLDGEEDAGAPPTLPLEDTTALRLELADQRHQLVRARRWLSADDQAVLSLWWLEATGQLTRAELATALAVSQAHGTVRVQRMHHQLELARSLTAAVEKRPRCADLDVVLRDWDGMPSSVWRKRILRHTRSCDICLGPSREMIAPENLLLGIGLLPVPVAVTAALLARMPADTATAAGGVKAGWATHVLQTGAVKPLSAMLLTGTVASGAALTITHWPEFTSPPPVVVSIPSPVPTPAPTPSPERSKALRSSAVSATPVTAVTSPAGRADADGPLQLGRASLEADDIGGYFASIDGDLGILKEAGPGDAAAVRQGATFEVVRGLADADCFSFQLDSGAYLRHSSWRVRADEDNGSDLFHGDATFCQGEGSTPGTISLEAQNYPGWFLRHRNMELWVDQDDGTAQFHADNSFRVRDPLAP